MNLFDTEHLNKFCKLVWHLSTQLTWTAHWIIIKRISTAPIYHTRWEHRAHYNNTNHTHTHTFGVGWGDRQGCEKQFRNNYERGASWGRLWKRRQNQSGGVFEANCSRQMGQHKKKIFHQMFLCLHRGWQRFMCLMQIITVLLAHKVEGNRTDIEGLFQRWNWSR